MAGLHLGNVFYLEEAVSDADWVLDLGSNTGEHMADLDCTTVSADISFDSTDADTNYCFADGRRLPFTDDVFDYVLCNQVLEHVEEKECVVSEIARVLKPDGEAIFSFPNRLSPTQPHPKLPRWFSYIPKSVGVVLSNYLFDETREQYYKNGVYPLSPFRAKQMLSLHFSSVQYTTFTNADKYYSRLQANSPISYPLLLLFHILLYMYELRIIKRVVEVLYPYTEYNCSNRY